MAVRPILRMGHPLLRQIAEPVTEMGSEGLHTLVADMWETMDEYGGVGLAAPQVGVSQRLVVFGMEEHPLGLELDAIPYTVLVNPVITPLDEAMEHGWEGCLSVPGMRGLVPRYTRIRYTGYDENGNPIEREVDGYHARVIQHECDHLDGILYPQRMDDFTQFGFTEELSESVACAPEEENQAERSETGSG